MNRVVTSREELIQAAGEIVFHEGADKLNIRYLAQKCGISVGSVYNYFPSKAELLFAVVEEFWKEVFHPDLCRIPEETAFPEFFEIVYHRLCRHLEDFRAIFVGQFEAMKSREKESGKVLEHIYIQHIQRGFLDALNRDCNIDQGVFHEGFAQEEFVSFLIANMLRQLGAGEKDCAYLKEVIKRIIYR